MFKCPNCGRNMKDDYVVLNLNRIKNGVFYSHDVVYMCPDCYNAVQHYSEFELAAQRGPEFADNPTLALGC